jgi:CBS domain-containing protein
MIQQKDNTLEIKGLDSSGIIDRSSLNIISKMLNQYRDILSIASKNIITLPPTTSIMGTVKTMLKHGFRRVPISDAGTNRLAGIITSLDIVDFLGGGLRHNLVKNRYNGNLVAAINEDVREIMKKDVVSLTTNNSITEALSTMIEKNIGGIPILNDQNAVVAMVSERDFVRTVGNITISRYVNEYMSK